MPDVRVEIGGQGYHMVQYRYLVNEMWLATDDQSAVPQMGQMANLLHQSAQIVASQSVPDLPEINTMFLCSVQLTYYQLSPEEKALGLSPGGSFQTVYRFMNAVQYPVEQEAGRYPLLPQSNCVSIHFSISNPYPWQAQIMIDGETVVTKRPKSYYQQVEPYRKYAVVSNLGTYCPTLFPEYPILQRGIDTVRAKSAILQIDLGQPVIVGTVLRLYQIGSRILRIEDRQAYLDDDLPI